MVPASYKTSIYIDGELCQIIPVCNPAINQPQYVLERNGSTSFYVLDDNAQPVACHHVPYAWMQNSNAYGIRTGGHLYKHDLD